MELNYLFRELCLRKGSVGGSLNHLRLMLNECCLFRILSEQNGGKFCDFQFSSIENKINKKQFIIIGYKVLTDKE